MLLRPHVQKSKKDPLPQDPLYRGQPGYTLIEQRRFGRILEEGRLIDAFRHMNPTPCENDFTWRGHGPEHARYYGRGMRIDYTIVSRDLLEMVRIVRAVVLGRGIDMKNFYGSDHCPILLELKEEKGQKEEQ